MKSLYDTDYGLTGYVVSDGEKPILLADLKIHFSGQHKFNEILRNKKPNGFKEDIRIERFETGKGDWERLKNPQSYRGLFRGLHRCKDGYTWSCNIELGQISFNFDDCTVTECGNDRIVVEMALMKIYNLKDCDIQIVND